MDKLLPLDEVLDMLNLSRSNERNMRRNGQMPTHLQIGRKVYYRLSAIEQWLVQKEVGNT